MNISRESLAQILFQVGFRGEDLVNMLAIAGRESGYRADAHRTNTDPSKLSGDRGLFQINYVNDKALMDAGIIRSASDLFDPVVNARAAKFLFDRDGYNPWTAGPGGWTAGGNAMYGTNVNEARAAVQRAEQQGLLGQNWAGGGSGPQSYGPQTVGQQSTDAGAHVALPPDAKIYVTSGFAPHANSFVFAVFEVNGVRLAYNVMAGPNDWKNFGNPTYVDQAGWESLGVTFAGDVQELSGIKDQWGSFGAFFGNIIDVLLGPYNPARNDPGVMKVLAEYAARPDMTEAELQARLETTEWWRTHTQQQLDWNGLSEAEKQLRIGEAGAQAADVWFRLTGQRIDGNDPFISHYAEQIASGALGWGQFNQIVADYAADIPESPYNRDTRAEQEAQRQRPIDIENTAQNIRQVLQRWGVSWTEDYILQYARGIVEKRTSDDDFMQAVKQQAAVLYPMKDPELETYQYAQPWLQTYQRVMERTGSLTTAEVQQALTAGTAPWEFEQNLKRNPAWMGTRNGQNEVNALVGELGRRMGYVAV